MHAPHTCKFHWRLEGVIGVTVGCELPDMGAGYLGSLQEQGALLTRVISSALVVPPLIIKTKQKMLGICPCIPALVVSGPPCDDTLLVKVMASTVARSAPHHGEYLLPNSAGFVWVASPPPHPLGCLTLCPPATTVMPQLFSLLREKLLPSMAA